MSREDVAGIFLYMLIVAISVIYGLAVLQPHFLYSSFDKAIIYALYILGSVVSAVLICAFLFELGHVIGAKIGGYRILSVCVLHLMLYKNDEGKIRFKFSNFDGLTGETKILPNKEKSSPRAYLLMGTLFITLFIVGMFFAFYFNMDYLNTYRGDLAYFMLTMGVVALIALIYNIIPFKLDSLNDGYRLSMISNPRNKEAFNELLRVEYEISKGNKDVEIKTFTELTNFTASLNMNKLYIALDKGNYEEALELVEIVINNKDTVSRKIYLRAVCNKIFLYFILKDRNEAAQFVLDNVSNELKKEILSDSRSLISIRAYILTEGLVDDSKSECMLAIANVNKAYKATAKNRRENEALNYNKAIDMLVDAHPKWNMQDYKLNLEVPNKEKSSEK